MKNQFAEANVDDVSPRCIALTVRSITGDVVV
eukprot:CAMPEP_0179005304 /NCGR_PEP_ID=MMETSP0795-20121207/13839_1 /TAXON_ID=88552 /ORGANISM="Amoebophrya sp., Strain Ameob2" /LENGTH=31 /DNA_ID= /DNA_START= /DNA_END= /DNA_ORIENTATION=